MSASASPLVVKSQRHNIGCTRRRHGSPSAGYARSSLGVSTAGPHARRRPGGHVREKALTFQYIPGMLASHDWRLRHGALITIAALGEGGARVMEVEFGKVVGFDSGKLTELIFARAFLEIQEHEQSVLPEVKPLESTLARPPQ
ncbi:hypothetical protein DFH11DRAFT_1733228 [Phellopilus nigrolimitatus]|nr:hypothetical protein DFH11DRAFT_1733228 [Phellopilus nigrolimitatus]